MIVTDLNYALENRLVSKLDIMIDRVTRKKPEKDAVIEMEGAEGEGKTNSSLAIAYYWKSKTNRDIHLFFRLSSFLKFAQSTEGKIIIWDEPSLDSLNSDWFKETNKDLTRLLMTCRIKRHMIIFNFTKFNKFAEYIVVDRSLGMIHMYSRHEIEPGRFLYIKKKKLEELYQTYRSSKKRLYKKFSSFGGNFPELMDEHFDKMGVFVEGKPNATYEDYKKLKNEAIQGIGNDNDNDKKKEEKKEFDYFKSKVGKLKLPISNKDELVAQLGISRSTLDRWSKANLKNEIDYDVDDKNIEKS